MRLRDARLDDLGAILSLNREWEHFLSPLDSERLARLHGMAAYHRVITEAEGKAVLAFLLAFREGADYDSSNYAWFTRRYDHFLYVDRLVVATAAQGTGLGSQLYEDLFSQALNRGIDHVCCEFDLNPPNPRSRAFHESFGFEEVGSRQDSRTGKRVSMRLLRL
ncbi:GNAT family N-acetyltransferase [Natronospira bacteriovora]|uniref:GNAT family N-acetyltransferase n=1 Tax=Natronospira bacteriovora TaxID=3069753 RepID=A0ABU0W6G9_9GAMM|nr:GNAT family N-acetyltransferase [Natronospira sp. AB-CW4]MDQ2069604.1 GNAT family N-acetyltransferase [Natronospira sp. AB-CW4]